MKDNHPELFFSIRQKICQPVNKFQFSSYLIKDLLKIIRFWFLDHDKAI